MGMFWGVCFLTFFDMSFRFPDIHDIDEYLENGKRYQKMSGNRHPITCPFYVCISHVSLSIFIYKHINDT